MKRNLSVFNKLLKDRDANEKDTDLHIDHVFLHTYDTYDYRKLWKRYTLYV